jgi:hypothetical protein
MSTPQSRILELVSWEEINDFKTVELVKEWANCRQAGIDENGNIWIADPQSRNWLADAEIERFLSWVDSQS